MIKKIIAAAVLVGLVLFLIPMGLRQNAKPDGGGSGDRTVPTDTLLDLPKSGHELAVQMPDGTIQNTDLNEYLWGVVAAEMPATFEEEALKAQAVAARTFALSNTEKPNHPDADVCTDYACCQAWMPRADAEANWGSDAVEKANKITLAVSETADQIALYDGAPIQAAFHSASGDSTQTAAEVWGYDAPYLQAVPSPEGEEVPDYHTTVTYTDQELKDLVQEKYPEANFGADPETWLSEPTYNKLDFIGPKTVPEGCVFVMGDNRNASIDSRKKEIGMLDTRLILGRAYYVIYPLSSLRAVG